MEVEETINVFETVDWGSLITESKQEENDAPIIKEDDKTQSTLEEFFDKEIKKSVDPPASTSKDEGVEDKVLEQIIEEDKDTNTSSSTFNALLIAKAFSEAGGLSDFDEEEFKKFIEEKGNTPEAEAEALMSYIQKEVDANAEAKKEEWKSSLSPEEKGRVEALELGIDPQVLHQAENEINILENIDVDDLDDEGAEKILRYHLQLSTSFSKEKIDKQIKKSKDLDSLIDDAKESIPELIDIRKNDIVELKRQANEAKELSLKKEQERVASIKETINSTTEILGKKINKQTQAKLQDMLLKPAKEINGKPVNAVWAKRADMGEVKFDVILAGLIANGAFDGKIDIGTKPKTKAFEELTNAIKSQTGSNQTSPGIYNKKATNIADKFEKMFGT